MRNKLYNNRKLCRIYNCTTKLHWNKDICYHHWLEHKNKCEVCGEQH